MATRTIIGTVSAAAVSALIWAMPSPASAQGYGPGMMFGPGNGPGMMYGQRGRGLGYGPGMMGYYSQGIGCPMMGFTSDGQTPPFAEGRIAFLKAELGITDAQKSQWDAYAESIKQNLQSMQSMWQLMRTAFEANTPVERLDAHITAMDSRLAALKQVKPALGNLYAALSPEQKKKADALLTDIGCMM